MTFFYLKKFSAALVVFTLVFSLVPWQKVEAGGGGASGGATEPTQLINTAEQTLNTALQKASNVWQSISTAIDVWTQKNKILSEITATVTSLLLEKIMAKITNDIVDWVKGVDDEPKFITDFGGFITDAVDDAAGEFLDEYLGLGFLCEPFRPFLQLAFKQAPFSERARCSISDVVGSIENFNNDFSQGGWDAWIWLAEEPQNTIHGAYLATYDELQKIKSQAAQVQQLKAQVGGGYKPLECTQEKIDEGMCTPDQKGQTLTPGSLILNMANKAITGEIDKKNMEIALFKSKVSYAPYVTAIADALIWRLTQETLATLKDTEIEEPDYETLPSPNYTQTVPVPEEEKVFAQDAQTVQKLLAALESYEETVKGISSQGVGRNVSSLDELINQLRTNRGVARNVESAGCSPSPSADSINEQISEIQDYINQIKSLSSQAQVGSFENIKKAKKATYEYQQALEAHLENFAGQFLPDYTEEMMAQEREKLQELKQATIDKSKEATGLVEEIYEDTEEESALEKLTEDIQNKTTYLASNVGNNLDVHADEVLAAVGLNQAQIDGWLNDARNDYADLQHQYNQCMAEKYPVEQEINITNNY